MQPNATHVGYVHYNCREILSPQSNQLNELQSWIVGQMSRTGTLIIDKTLTVKNVKPYSTPLFPEVSTEKWQ